MTRGRLALTLVLVLASGVARADPDGGAADEAESAAAISLSSGQLTVTSVEVEFPDRFNPVQQLMARSLVAVKTGDVLSRDAVRDTIDRLMATGEYADVIVYEEPHADGVGLRFQLVPQKKLVAFSFLGANPARRASLNAVALQSLGELSGRRDVSLPTPFFPEQLEKLRTAIEREYQDRGFQSAKVDVREEDENDTDVTVSFTIDEGSPTRLAGISVAGEPRLAPEELQATLGIKLGDVLDRDAIEAGVKKLRQAYEKQHYYRAQVGQWVQTTVGGARGGGDEALLQLPVEAGPEIRFHFHGNTHFDDRVLATRLGFSTEDTLDDTEEERMANRVREFYVLSGFLDAQVQPEEVWSPDRSKMMLIFDVDEGEPLIVERVQFQGNAHFSNDFLVDRVHESLREAVPGPDDQGAPSLEEGELALTPSDAHSGVQAYRADPDTVFAEGPYKDALGRIIDLYKADGFTKVQVELPTIDIDEHTRKAVVTVSVVEGPRTVVSRIDIAAPDAGIDTHELLVHAPLKVGGPYNSADEENTRLVIAHRLQSQGYLFAKVKTTTVHFSPDLTGVDASFAVDPLGPLVHVRSVIIRGNENTRESVIRAGIALKPGDLFDQSKVDESERNLAALGVFTRVEVHPLDPDHQEAEKDLVVDVDERPRTEIVVAPGGSLVDGPRLGLEIDRYNVGGLGLDASLQAKVNYFQLSYPVLSGLVPTNPDDIPDPTQRLLAKWGGHIDLGVRDPRVFLFQPAQVSANFDLLAEEINRPAYRYNREAALLGFDWQITRWLSASLLNTVESFSVYHQQLGPEVISNLNQNDLKIFFINDGTTQLFSVLPGFTVDFRDNAANPHFGFYFTANAEVAHSLFADPSPECDPTIAGAKCRVSYIKPTATATVYLPIGRRATLALSARFGRIYQLGNTDGFQQNIPAPKRFFLGGPTTLRGYPVDGLIPADERAAFESDVTNCRRLVSPSGCAEDAVIINQGSLLPSQGGQAFVLYKVELRFPISGAVEGAIFADAGNLWFDPTNASLGNLQLTPGLGIRYGTPVGPLALDVAMNPFPDTKLNETVFSTSYVQFSIGLF